MHATSAADFNTQVKQAFEGDHERAFGPEYVSELLTNWRDVEKTLSRTVVLLVLTSIAAGLVGREEVSKLTVASVEIEEVGWLRLGLPVVVAYLYTTTFSLLAESFMQLEAFRSVVRALWPSLYESNLHVTLFPANMTMGAGFKVAHALSAKRTRSLVEAASFAKVAFLLVGPVAFELYLYYLAFQTRGALDPLLWLSAGSALTLCVVGVVYFVAAMNTYESP